MLLIEQALHSCYLKYKHSTICLASINLHHHHHHHVVLVARISLTLSRHFSLSFIASGRSSGLHPVFSHSCWMYVRAGHPAFARPCVGVHKGTSLMISSLLLQQCPACLVHLTWIVFVIGGRWPYSWCLVGCCHQDLFMLTAPSIFYFCDSFSSFIHIANSWKCRMILLVIWAFSFVGIIFFYMVWVFLATPSLHWMSSAAFIVVFIFLTFKAPRGYSDVCMYVFTNPSACVGCDTNLTGLNSVFLLREWLPNQSRRIQSVLLFTHSWRENNSVHTFSKGISTVWNAINLVQDLNSCHQVNFLCQAPPFAVLYCSTFSRQDLIFTSFKVIGVLNVKMYVRVCISSLCNMMDHVEY